MAIPHWGAAPVWDCHTGAPPQCGIPHWGAAPVWDLARPSVGNEEAFKDDAFDKDLVEPDKMTIQDPVEHILEGYILKRSRR